jgi:hypothetical protein
MGLTVNEKKAKYAIVSATQKGSQTQNWKAGDKSIQKSVKLKISWQCNK